MRASFRYKAVNVAVLACIRKSRPSGALTTIRPADSGRATRDGGLRRGIDGRDRTRSRMRNGMIQINAAARLRPEEFSQ